MSPRARREVVAKGKNVDFRHAGPCGSAAMGAITFTSCAIEALVTRSACRSSDISRLPTTTPSATV